MICISSTGSGKSRIYEVFAKDSAQRTLIVSPLIALARQQKEKLEAFGLSVFLSAGNHSIKNDALSALSKSRVWIASPEQLSRPFYRNLFQSWKPDFFVVDECHCLWDWGAEFRPSFLGLPEFARQVERSLWLTATLPLEARHDLRKRLPRPLIEMGKFDLPENLHLEIRHTPWFERSEVLLEWIARRNGSPGIVFVSSRQSTERISRLLRGFGKKAVSYHAGLSVEERRIIELQVSKQEIEILVSTSAFGMGMDHSHLGWVLLWQPPSSILQLTQSLGRVGRDREKEAFAAVFWSFEDFRSPGAKSLKTFFQTPGCRISAVRKHYEDETLFRSRGASKPCLRCDFCH